MFKVNKITLTKGNIMKLQTRSPPPRVPHSQTPRFSNTAPPAVQKIE